MVDDDESNVESREERWPDGRLKARWTVLVSSKGAEERHGTFETFHENGNPHERRQYAYGEAIGEWLRWDEEGTQLEASLPEEEPPEANPDQDKPWRTWIIELVVVMALAWLAYMVNGAISLWSVRDYPSREQAEQTLGESYKQHMVSTDPEVFFLTEIPAFAVHLQILLPLLYICWRSDLTWRQLAIRRPTMWGLLLLGPLLGALSLGADTVLDRIFRPEDAWWYIVRPSTTVTWTALVVVLIANSVVEEFVWRGFVLQRLRQMSGSTVFSLLVSTFLFAMYHIYQGFGNAGLVFISGLIWGVAVIVTRRIWPAVVGHTVHNFVLYTPLADYIFS